MMTGANYTHQEIPDFWRGLEIHSQHELQGQKTAHKFSADTILSIPESVLPGMLQDPNNRLANVSELLRKKQSLTIRQITTLPKTVDGKSEKFKFFEDVFHTMIQMQPLMTKETKINRFVSLLTTFQTFRTKTN